MKYIYETFVILNMFTSSRSRNIFEKITNLNFTTNGIIKINTNFNYIYDEKYNFKHIYYFFNNDKVFKKYHFLMIGHQMLLKMNLKLKVLILHQ